MWTLVVFEWQRERIDEQLSAIEVQENVSHLSGMSLQMVAVSNPLYVTGAQSNMRDEAFVCVFNPQNSVFYDAEGQVVQELSSALYLLKWYMYLPWLTVRQAQFAKTLADRGSESMSGLCAYVQGLPGGTFMNSLQTRVSVRQVLQNMYTSDAGQNDALLVSYLSSSFFLRLTLPLRHYVDLCGKADERVSSFFLGNKRLMSKLDETGYVLYRNSVFCVCAYIDALVQRNGDGSHIREFWTGSVDACSIMDLGSDLCAEFVLQCDEDPLVHANMCSRPLEARQESEK